MTINASPGVVNDIVLQAPLGRRQINDGVVIIKSGQFGKLRRAVRVAGKNDGRTGGFVAMNQQQAMASRLEGRAPSSS
ncbi:MAG: hypothetical protein ACRDRP_05615 [Pseudonocardiaceae bacterium]